jgi:hypothetical protein
LKELVTGKIMKSCSDVQHSRGFWNIFLSPCPILSEKVFFTPQSKDFKKIIPLYP